MTASLTIPLLHVTMQDMDHSGGLALVIANKYGSPDSLNAACLALIPEGLARPLPTGECIVTDSGNISSARKIIHVS